MGRARIMATDMTTTTTTEPDLTALPSALHC
jgi:hypothetical protein